MTLTSPCTGVCKLDDATGWCLGCGRDGEEIAGWRSQSEPWRNLVWDQIPGRLGALGVACRRLDWTTCQIRDFVQQTLQEARGTWVMGVVGAVAEYLVPPGASAEVAQHGHDVVARTQNGAIRMTLNDNVRAVTFDPSGSIAPPRIVLAVKRESGRLPVSDGLSALGEDKRALIADSDTQLYDLGLRRKEARFCVRVTYGPVRLALERAAGRNFAGALATIGPVLAAQSPTRVVETALGRIEVQGPIPAPDARSPDGPHTHLLPDHLAAGRALPVGMDLPRAYLPGAIFYPS